MTDFGSRLGLGDMLKSVYDANRDGIIDSVIAHKLSHQLTGADQISVAGLLGELAAAQPSTWAKVTGKPTTFAPSAHKASHEYGGTDPISVAGLVGTTPRAILGDATPGRVLRKISITIANGSTASTLKCTVTAMWNGNAIAEQDDIGKNATTGHFHLTAAGTALTILNSGLTGSALDGTVSLYFNQCGTALLASAIKTDAGLVLNFIGTSDGVGLDLTVLVDTGIIIPHILYITDA